VWVYLLVARGRFWLIREERLSHINAPCRRVAAVIPARNESPVISKAITSLAAQDYDGELHIIVVDDESSDQTVTIAKRAGAMVIHAGALPPGWTGKLSAVAQGVKYAESFNPDYLLLTDADIVHSRDNVRTLVARAEAGGLDLVSLMVRLHCRSIAERALIPAFVYFFFQLYPPCWIASARHKTAGAAGGCMLIRPATLERIGGIEAIRSELIDDCALAKRVKHSGGKIWLGVTESTHSVREYGSFTEIFQMISRSAFNQLHHSALWLLATIFAIAILYLAPPFLPLTGGLAAWILMAISYVPILRFYRQPLFLAPLLPCIALFYLAATIHSAVRYWAGSGGVWKGRAQDVG
jgi:hopene-associated glycosyltransferase HpnB